MKRWPKGTWMKLASPDTLKALIRQRDLSYADVARAAGCHKSFIGALANGTKSTCKPVTGERIAKCLQVPVEILFVASVSPDGGRTGNPQSKEPAA